MAATCITGGGRLLGVPPQTPDCSLWVAVEKTVQPLPSVSAGKPNGCMQYGKNSSSEKYFGAAPGGKTS